MELRVEAKLKMLRGLAEVAEEGHLMEQAYVTRLHANSYEILLSQPLSMWAWACSVPDSPLLWSKDCACCEPEAGCTRVSDTETWTAFVTCCYTVYARKVLESADAVLDASIQEHLRAVQPSRSAIKEYGPKLSWQLGGASLARGCIVSIHANASISTCPEDHACRGFDCSFLRALCLALQVIQAINPLPAMDFLVNAGDETLQNAFPEAPVFTRGGTLWTPTLTLPFEWQMHPAQCGRSVKVGMNAMSQIRWEEREPILVWRGSHSNLWTPHCKMAQAARNDTMLEKCVSLPAGETREPIWNFSTWLDMPRGRLLMLTRFSSLVDARFTESKVVPMSEDLERFLREEGLFGDRIQGEQLARYKYHIAIEGNCAADRVCWQPFLGSVLLIPDGPWQMLPPINVMKPWVHYVPVLHLFLTSVQFVSYSLLPHILIVGFKKLFIRVLSVSPMVRYDLSDVIEKLLWLRSHDDEAKTIAMNAVAFAHRSTAGP